MWPFKTEKLLSINCKLRFSSYVSNIGIESEIFVWFVHYRSTQWLKTFLCANEIPIRLDQPAKMQGQRALRGACSRWSPAMDLDWGALWGSLWELDEHLQFSANLKSFQGLRSQHIFAQIGIYLNLKLAKKVYQSQSMESLYSLTDKGL